jgi:hypothetical protein
LPWYYSRGFQSTTGCQPNSDADVSQNVSYCAPGSYTWLTFQFTSIPIWRLLLRHNNLGQADVALRKFALRIRNWPFTFKCGRVSRKRERERVVKSNRERAQAVKEGRWHRCPFLGEL